MCRKQKVIVDTALLEDAIAKSGIKKKKIAELLGLSTYGLSKKIRNETEFLATEIVLICEILHLSPEMRELIFFTLRVDCEST